MTFQEKIDWVKRKGLKQLSPNQNEWGFQKGIPPYLVLGGEGSVITIWFHDRFRRMVYSAMPYSLDRRYKEMLEIIGKDSAYRFIQEMER